jgi:hypothetical protein
MGQRAIPSWVNRHSYHSAEQTVKNKKLDHRVKEDWAGYKVPKSQTARLYKNQGKEYNDVPLRKLEGEALKTHTNFIFDQRKADAFTTEVMQIGPQYFVLTPGTDIGLVEGLPAPQYGKLKKMVPLERVGKPKTYAALTAKLDEIVEEKTQEKTKPSNIKRKRRKSRSRLGKDIERLSRNHELEEPYQDDQLESMREIAGVIRLDKGRVPKATHYIRTTLISGTSSFTDLFVNNHYVGAGTGGVEQLRGQQEEGGEKSEGSDMEESEESDS